MTAYAEELQNIDPARLELALKALMKVSEFWPSLAKIQEQERNLTFGDDDARIFRKTELLLIQLNDEFKGGVWSREQYHAKYQTILDASGITREQLEKGTVYKPDKSGSSPEPTLTWDQLEWRRRQYLTQDAPKSETGSGRPRQASQSVEGIRQALSNSLTGEAKVPKDVQRWMDEEKQA